MDIPSGNNQRDHDLPHSKRRNRKRHHLMHVCVFFMEGCLSTRTTLGDDVQEEMEETISTHSETNPTTS